MTPHKKKTKLTLVRPYPNLKIQVPTQTSKLTTSIRRGSQNINWRISQQSTKGEARVTENPFLKSMVHISLGKCTGTLLNLDLSKLLPKFASAVTSTVALHAMSTSVFIISTMKCILLTKLPVKNNWSRFVSRWCLCLNGVHTNEPDYASSSLLSMFN